MLCNEHDLVALRNAWPTADDVHGAHYTEQREGTATYLVVWQDEEPLGSGLIQWHGPIGMNARAAFPGSVEVNHLQVRQELVGRYSKILKPPISPQFFASQYEQPGRTYLERLAAAPRVHAIERRLEASVVEQLVQDYEAGVPPTQLAQRYGMGKGSVLKLLRDNGATVRRQGLSAPRSQRPSTCIRLAGHWRRLERSSVMRTPSYGKHRW